MFDGKAFGEQILSAVKNYVASSVSALSERFGQLEERIKAIPAGQDGKDGKDGADGRNAFEVAVSLGYEGTVHEWMESLQGKNGKDGVDGKSVTPEDIQRLIDEAVKFIPPPKDGTNGKDGADGKSVTIEDVRPLVEEAFKAIQIPKDGKDGRDGVDGKSGADGKSITVEDFLPLFETALAKAMLEHERRATDLIQRCIDRIPKPKDGVNGKDGRDAFDLGDIQLSLAEDERTLTLAFIRGEERIERSIVLTHPIYRGVWREGEFVKGDSVTYGGSTWIATRATSSKPELDDSWRLSVKRGRDGKDGAKGERGIDGRNGRDALRL